MNLLGEFETMRGIAIYVHGYNELKFEVEPIYQFFSDGTFRIIQNDGPLKDLFLNMNPVKTRIAHKNFKVSPYYRRFYKTVKVALS